MHIVQLPTDIFIIILSYVNPTDLIACKQVCKSFRSIFKTSVFLSRQHLLARAGLVESAAKHPGKDWLRLLRELERKWYPSVLQPTKQLKTDFENPCTAVQINGGFVVAGVRPRNYDCFREVHVHQLPSYLPRYEVKARTWKLQLAGSGIKDFKTDPAQDLLVLLEVLQVRDEDGSNSVTLRLSLRTLSSNEPHPAASSSSITLNNIGGPAPHSTESISIRICMDMLAISVTSFDVTSTNDVVPKSILAIWQWTSGQKLAGVVLSGADSCNLTFVERDLLLLTGTSSPREPSLDLVRLRCGGFYSRSPNPSITPLHSIKGITFCLPRPPCSKGCVLSPDIRIINDPAPHPRHHHAKQGYRAPLFTPDFSPDFSIIGFSVAVTPSLSGSTIHHTLLVRASVFTSYAASLAYPTEPIPFESWSAQGARWFLGKPGFICGQKYVHITPSSKQANVKIYDFNPHHTPTQMLSGWQTLITTSKQPALPPAISPKMSYLKTKAAHDCSHKYYFDCGKLRQSMKCKEQTMKVGFCGPAPICALDCERIIVLETDGGYAWRFTSYNV